MHTKSKPYADGTLKWFRRIDHIYYNLITEATFMEPVPITASYVD
jgi:hypothetical protein